MFLTLRFAPNHSSFGKFNIAFVIFNLIFFLIFLKILKRVLFLIKFFGNEELYEEKIYNSYSSKIDSFIIKIKKIKKFNLK